MSNIQKYIVVSSKIMKKICAFINEKLPLVVVLNFHKSFYHFYRTKYCVRSKDVSSLSEGNIWWVVLDFIL